MATKTGSYVSKDFNQPQIYIVTTLVVSSPDQFFFVCLFLGFFLIRRGNYHQFCVKNGSSVTKASHAHWASSHAL